MALKIYTLANCDRCRAATKWLRAHEIGFTEIPIREQPPTRAELKTMLAATGERRRLFNTSGRDYREAGVADRLPGMTDAAALDLLAGNGNLIKRPFVIGDGVALVGFSEEAWRAALA